MSHEELWLQRNSGLTGQVLKPQNSASGLQEFLIPFKSKTKTYYFSVKKLSIKNLATAGMKLITYTAILIKYRRVYL